MIRAVIDIGSNSVRLLIAEEITRGEWKTLKKSLVATRLGEGMANTASILSGPQQRTLQAVEKFVKIAREAGADEIRAYGTAVMRDAPQGQFFADEIKEKTGIHVRILKGKEEAFYSYIGAAGNSGAITAVVDIGGGSTEICVGFGTDIGFRISLALGCVRSSCQFDVTAARGLGELKKHCFDLFRQADEAASVKRWICVGGTATSAASIMEELPVYDPQKVQDYVIRQEDISALLRRLYGMSYEERCHVQGLAPDRADIIVAGIAILDSLMEYFALPEVIVSDRDLVNGLLEEDILAP